MLFWADYYLRWWRLLLEERACRKTDLGGGDYYLRNSGLPPSLRKYCFNCDISVYNFSRLLFQSFYEKCPSDLRKMPI